MRERTRELAMEMRSFAQLDRDGEIRSEMWTSSSVYKPLSSFDGSIALVSGLSLLIDILTSWKLGRLSLKPELTTGRGRSRKASSAERMAQSNSA
eukprot:754283-Hanusia_phi.AAC.3